MDFIGQLPAVWLLFSLGFVSGVVFETLQDRWMIRLVEDEKVSPEDRMDQVTNILRRRTYLGLLGFATLIFLLVEPPAWASATILLSVSPVAGVGVGLLLSALARHLARRLREAGE